MKLATFLPMTLRPAPHRYVISAFGRRRFIAQPVGRLGECTPTLDDEYTKFGETFDYT
jgi:hypothetical protein